MFQILAHLVNGTILLQYEFAECVYKESKIEIEIETKDFFRTR